MAVTTEECEILAALADPGAGPAERSAGGVARRLAMAPEEAERLIRLLEVRSPALVQRDPDTDLEV